MKAATSPPSRPHDDAAASATGELLDAIEGRRGVSLFLVDETPARRIATADLDQGGLVLGAPADGGHGWRYADDVVYLQRGECMLPIFDGRQQAAVVLRLAKMAGITLPAGLGLLRVIVERDGTPYLLHEKVPGSAIEGLRYTEAAGLPPSSTLMLARDRSESAPSDDGESTSAGDPQSESSTRDALPLATPLELIEAFGAHTGMNATWFNNLNDAPSLKRARKAPGRGGKRGHRTHPLFCPYAVMQWLISPKRKKGKPLEAKAGWRLLRRHFPDVYRQFEIGDPNTKRPW